MKLRDWKSRTRIPQRAAKRRVQDAHELVDAVPACWRERVPVQYLDQDRCCALPRLLDRLDSSVGVVAGVELGDSCCTGRCAQDVPYLVCFRDGVQICRRGRVPGGAGGEPRNDGGRLLRGSMCVERRDTLQFGPPCTVGEPPRGIDGGARPGIIRVRVPEEGVDLLSAFRHVAGDYPELVHGQVKVAGHDRHGLDSSSND